MERDRERRVGTETETETERGRERRSALQLVRGSMERLGRKVVKEVWAAGSRVGLVLASILRRRRRGGNPLKQVASRRYKEAGVKGRGAWLISSRRWRRQRRRSRSRKLRGRKCASSRWLHANAFDCSRGS